MSRRTQLRWLAVLALAALAIGAIAVLRNMFAAPAEAPATDRATGVFRPTSAELSQLTITRVEKGGYAELVRATGTIAVDADHSTPVVLPFSGQVTDVMVEAGQSVARGQPLLRISSSDLVDARNALLTASAQEATASEAVRIAEANAKRQQAIVETAGGAPKDYQQAQADLVSAQSTLRTAQAAMLSARNKLALFGSAGSASGWSSAGNSSEASTVYRAPATGVIADRSVAPGQFIGAAANTPLMTITDLSHVWLIAQLPEGESAGVHLGDQVAVTTPALPGMTFEARIDNIAASLDPATHRLPVRATVANASGALKPQMFASFAIRHVLASDVGVLVPAAAVIHEEDSARVWVLRGDGALVARRVEIGGTEGGFTRVVAGLAPGERIVSAGALFVNEAGLGG